MKDVSCLPCGGSPYCPKPHNQWTAFESEVDYVMLLVAKQLEVSSEDNGTMVEDHSGAGYNMHQCSSHKLRESQKQDHELTPVITWLEGKVPTQNDLNSKVWRPVRYGISRIVLHKKM